MTDAARDGGLTAEEAKVFLSYSRKDRERAAGVAEALRARHFGVFKDTDDILPTEEWKTRLEELIEEADTIVFLLSPHSAASEVCAWEVEYATALHKRIAPIVIEDVEGSAIPPLLARLNFIFCTDRDPFEDAVDTLASALSTDIDWIREHTRLAGLARRWGEASQPARLLLRGQDIADAEGWRDRRPMDAPAVTADQAGFIAESRRAAGRRLRNWITGSLALTVGAAGLALFAWFQSVEADRQRDAAERNAAQAREQRAVATEQRDRALETQSLFLADLAHQMAARGDNAKGLALAYEGAPKEADLSDRPLIPEIQVALARTLDALEISAVMRTESEGLTAITVRPQGDLVATGSWDGIVRLWDAETGRLIRTFEGHEQNVRTLAFDAEGGRLATAGGSIRVWEVATGEMLRRLEGHTAAIADLAFSPDGDRLVSGSWDNTARIWSLIEPDAAPLVLNRHKFRVLTLDISPDGRMLATGGRSGDLWLWDMATGMPLRELVSEDASGPAAAVAFSPDGQQVLAMQSGLVIWDAVSGDQIRRVEGFYHTDTYTSDFSPDRKRLVNVSQYDGIARVWDTETGAEVTALAGLRDAGYEEFFMAAAFFPDSKTVAVGSGSPRALIWNTEKPAPAVPETGYPANISTAKLADAGSAVISGLTDGTVLRWDAETGAPLRQDTGPAPVTAVAAANDIIVTGDNTGRVTISDRNTGTTTAQFALPQGGVSKIAVLPTGDRIGIIASDGSGYLHDLETGDGLVRIEGHEGSIIAIAFSPDGTRVISTGSDMTAAVSDAATGARLTTFDGHEAEVSAAVFTSDGSQALTGDWLGFLRLWDVATGAEIASARAHDATIGTLSLSSDGARLISAGGDNVVRMWDIATLSEIDAVAYQNSLFDAAFTAAGDLVRVLHLDGSVSAITVWAKPQDLIRAAREAVDAIQPLSIADRCDAFLETRIVCATE